MGRADARRARQRDARRSERGRASDGGRGGIRRFFTWKKIVGAFFGLCLLGMAGFVGLYLYVDIPEGNADAKKQSNIYKYSDGKLLARTGDVNREIVDLADVPKPVQHTFVAAENKSFYTDSGIDFKGTARGLINTLSGKGKQGGSTITQQYVKNFYLNQDQTVSRKLRELVISLKVDQQKTKDDILAGYINTSYYGRGAWGIQAAAQAYYHVDAKQLKVEQGAYLAALLQAPNQYDWAIASGTGKRLAKARWNYVLDNMVEKHWLDAGKRQGMTFPVPESPRPPANLAGQKGYLFEAAKAEVKSELHLTDAQFEAGGYTITLNINQRKQRELERAVKSELTSQLSPKTRNVDADVQAGAASVDPKTGKVLALYGGPGLTKHWTNNATRRDYQPASTFKPLILAAALDRSSRTQDGQPITARTLYDGTSRRPVQGSNIAFAPPNEDNQSYGPISVQRAMNDSVNSVFAQMGVDVGMEDVLKTAGDLGMNVKGLPVVPAQTLGSMGASPLEMAGVYATLDNHGKKVTPQIVKSVTHQGAPVELPSAIGDQVISRQAADSVTSVLTGVVDDGTARQSVRDAANRNGQQVAGKTGTSDDNKSAWFTGYTPKLVTSVGLFGEAAKDGKTVDGKPVHQRDQVTLRGTAGGGRVNGGTFPARIWAAYTFNAMGAPSEFDLDTDMGAAVAPPPDPTPSHTQKPTSSPSTEAPTTKPPTTPPPSKSPTTQAPTTEPTDEPTTEEPTAPDPTATDDVPDNPRGGPAGN
ncbi:transglycosylase domain-containing protein [Streptomyces sp. NPDC002004]